MTEIEKKIDEKLKTKFLRRTFLFYFLNVFFFYFSSGVLHFSSFDALKVEREDSHSVKLKQRDKYFFPRNLFVTLSKAVDEVHYSMGFHVV